MCDADVQAEKQRKLLRVRIEMAKFLQETVRGSGLKMDNVIKSDIVMEQLSNSDDIGIRRGFSSRSNLYISLDTLRGVLES